MRSIWNRHARTLAVFMLAVPLVQQIGTADAATPIIHKVGAITWHAGKYASQVVTVSGYVLAKDAGYVLFSDEPAGKISSHDLPVIGPGIDQMQLTKKYVLTGQFVAGGLQARNGNSYHLELSAAPLEAAH